MFSPAGHEANAAMPNVDSFDPTPPTFIVVSLFCHPAAKCVSFSCLLGAKFISKTCQCQAWTVSYQHRQRLSLFHYSVTLKVKFVSLSCHPGAKVVSKKSRRSEDALHPECNRSFGASGMQATNLSASKHAASKREPRTIIELMTSDRNLKASRESSK